MFVGYFVHLKIHKLPHGSHKKPKRGINSRMKNFRSEDPKRNLPGRFALTITILTVMMSLNCILRKSTSAKIHEIIEKITHLCTWTTSNCLKNEKRTGDFDRNVKDIGIEFSIEKYAMLMRERGEKQIREGIEPLNWKETERLEKRKITSTWEY